MTTKRALVVDDSRSARAFLARILERHNLEVDGAESAEAALEYLQRVRPDVIFMDHLMPGMDGFQAVQLIKKDPRTATIPILMYTSQEGELYLSQARALGALGVLPKQTRPADVTKALLQLHLVDNQPGQDGELGATALSSTTTIANVPQELRELVNAVLRDKSDEMRRFVTHSLDEHSTRLDGQFREILEETAAHRQPPPAAPKAGRWANGLMLALSVISVIGAGVLAWSWYQAMQQQDAFIVRLQDLETQLKDSSTRLDAMRAELADRLAALAQAQVRAETPPPLLQETLTLGEAPLSGSRVELIRTQLDKLLASGYRGRAELRIIPGRFCLRSTAGETLALADPDTPYAKCSEMNDAQLAALTAQRESVTFANMLAALRKRSGDALQLQTVPGTTAETNVPYPSVTDTLTAGEWNRAAAQNYRLELRTVVPPVMPPATSPLAVTSSPN